MTWTAQSPTPLRPHPAQAAASFPLGTAPADPHSDGALIEDLARVVALECQADDILVAVHGPDGDPTPLLFTGVHAGDDTLQRCLLAAADDSAPGEAAWTMVALSGNRTAGAMTTSIADDSAGRITVTTVFETIGEATRGRARAVAGRLSPFVSAFFRLWQRRTRAVAQLRGLTAAVNHSDVGIVIVDRSATILFSNGAADALLRDRDGVRATGARLAASRLADTLRLHAAVAHVAASGGEVAIGPGDAPVIALERVGRRPLMAAMVAAASRDGDGAGTVIVHLFDPELDLGTLVDPVCKLYGLSPVETRLARLLAGGVSLAEAAAAMRVREASARSYLKQVFLKTDTNRQGELVWLLLRSSVRTAPACPTSFVAPLKWG